MKRGDKLYIWQEKDWPHWTFDLGKLAAPLAEASRLQGLLLGRLSDVGLADKDKTTLSILTKDVVKTSEIEGDRLDESSVRSSIARHLGVDIGALAPVDRHVEGVVQMVMDATNQPEKPLSVKRLFAWHAALFPTGYSGLSTLRVAQWRDDAKGPMQVVSGPMHRRKVHYEAPPAEQLNVEMELFLSWANAKTQEPLIIKAGLAHLWFVTLHPFEDGNGRIARAVGDLFLSRADQSSQRFYSLSAQIQKERKAYYDILEATQKGGLDVTEWLVWFLSSLQKALKNAHDVVEGVVRKSQRWQRWGRLPLNARQVKILNRLLDGFEGKLTTTKWAAIAKCSQDTALRDISELLDLGILEKSHSGGRSTNYELKEF